MENARKQQGMQALAPDTGQHDLAKLYTQLQNEVDVINKIAEDLRAKLDTVYGPEPPINEVGVDAADSTDAGGEIGSLFEMIYTLNQRNAGMAHQVSRMYRL
jgi:hypothetical protein